MIPSKQALIATVSAVVAATAVSTTSALAEGHAPTLGDAAAGEEAFSKQCVTCHVVVDDSGEKLAGRTAKTGPNLYASGNGGVIGSVDGFRYGNGIEALNEQGMTWDEEKFVAYVQDPTRWLRETSGNKRVRGKMTYKVRSEEDAQNIYAYLYSLANPG